MNERLSPAWVAVLLTLTYSRLALGTHFEQIQAAWMKRTREVASAEVFWTDHRLASISDEDGSNRREVLQQIPDMRILLNQGQVRFEDVFAGETPETSGHIIDAYNGSEFRVLFYANGKPQGAISTDVRPSFSNTLSAWPPLLLYRGCDAALVNRTLLDFRNATVIEVPNGDVLLRETIKGPSGIERNWSLWVRPDLDYAPIRLLSELNGSPISDIKIESERGDDSVIRPTSWSVLLKSQNGHIIQLSDAIVEKCNINREVDSSLFDLEFPVGTIVLDHRPRTTGGDTRMFLVLEDGEREVTSAELRDGGSTVDSRRTPGDDAARNEPDSPIRWYVWTSILAIATLVLLIIAMKVRIKA